MNKKYILSSLYKIANTLDVSGLHKEASSLTNLMKRLAEDDTNFDPRQKDFPLDTYRAMGPARGDLSGYNQNTTNDKPKYDYTKESLYDSLSDFGKKYVADRNKERVDHKPTRHIMFCWCSWLPSAVRKLMLPFSDISWVFTIS